MNYYNENDPKAAAWLRELIREGHISNGIVDERSIVDVQPNDLHGYNQCHFFAGIGGWSYAFRLTGIPDDAPVWTGSCPCQPFSQTGKQLGIADERHLWPAFFNLIRKCKPTTAFGEQVASPLGRKWFSGVRDDMEGVGYAVGAADLCAASVASPQWRQRLYWVAYSNCHRWQQSPKIQWQGSLPITHYRGSANSCRPWDAAPPVLQRRIKSGLVPVVDGVPGRVGLLRGYGNAIVPQVAAEFIRASYEANHDVRSDVLMSDPMF